MQKRLAAHGRGVASKYTASRLPVELAASWEMPDAGAARRLEYAIKQLPRAEKLALLSGRLPLPV